MERSKPDVILSDGREVVIDLNKITLLEFDDLQSEEQTRLQELAVMSKVVGFDLSEIGFADYIKIQQAFVAKCKQLSNPT